MIQFLLVIVLFFTALAQSQTETDFNPRLLNTVGKNVVSRILSPEGYNRIDLPQESFAAYLRTVTLKPHGEYAHYFSGEAKDPQGVYVAAFDQSIGKRDLHQCADAIMRLKADYHYSRKEYHKIQFDFTNGFTVAYSKWRKGYRISVKGNTVKWVKRTHPTDSYKSYWKYMEIIFSYAGTLSLAKELKPVSIQDLYPGDVFIQGGSPGHAVLVLDVAINKKGSKKFLLAQSYMPAQQTQILINPADAQNSPWFSIPKDGIVNTPEWRFLTSDLKRF